VLIVSIRVYSTSSFVSARDSHDAIRGFFIVLPTSFSYTLLTTWTMPAPTRRTLARDAPNDMAVRPNTGLKLVSESFIDLVPTLAWPRCPRLGGACHLCDYRYISKSERSPDDYSPYIHPLLDWIIYRTEGAIGCDPRSAMTSIPRGPSFVEGYHQVDHAIAMVSYQRGPFVGGRYYLYLGLLPQAWTSTFTSC
jgi:hypothetical protein